MENENIVVVKKKSTFWTVVKVLLVVAAVSFVAYKIYQKFFKNKKAEALADTEEPAQLDAACEACEDVAEEEVAFEVPAESVIANAENMVEEA